MIKQIKKRNGQLVDFDANKLNKWATWAADLNGVEWASVALDAVKKCYDCCTTSELQKAMISACLDREDEAHLYMAGRLYSAECYKEVFGSFKNIPTLKEMYHTMTKAHLWQNMNYSDSELDIIGSAINHDLDLTYPYNQLFQIKNKYALTNRATGKCYETPQFTFMRVALGSMAIQPKSTRVSDVISVYKYLSSGKINAPTPYMLYFGTGHLGLASCFPPGVPVSTLSGVKKIEDVQNGDYVLTHNGNYKKVYYTSNKPYIGKFVRINTTATFTDDFVSTQDHRIFTIKSNSSRSILNDLGNNTPEWVAADNIRLGDYVKIGLCTDTSYEDVLVYDIVRNNYLMSDFLLQDNLIFKLNVDDSINQRQNAIVNFNIRSDVFFRLLGYYIAEGCVCSPSRPNSEHLIFTFNSKEVAFISDVVSILESYGCAVSINNNPLDNSTKISVHSKVLCALMIELAGTGFNKKKLSQIILLSDIELQKHLLAGVIRGDGSAIISGFSLTLYNVHLVSQIRDIALRCKIPIRISKSSKLKSGATCIDANICFNIDGNSTFALLVNKDIHKIRKGKSAIGRNIVFLNDGVYARARMISSYEEECTVYDLSVEDDASFVVNGISVHNCCVYISKDDIPSISAGDHIAYMMTCASAGIGAAMLTRSKGDPVRNGTIKHLGKLPYYKVVESNVCANKQAGRGGACTMHFNCLDPEIEDLLRLRHPKTVDDKKIKNIDYSLVYNKLFLQKAAKNEDWMLVSYFHAKDLWEAMYSDDLDKFTEKYNHYLSIDIPKKMVNARDIAKFFLVNSYEVGRIYEFAADNANSHTPFNDTIYSSNLCQEVMLPTKPFNGVMDIYEYNSDGEIALCHLMAICVGRVSEQEYEDVAYYALLIADNAISIMDYPFESLATSAISRRSVGVGITNLAYAMALNNLRYDSVEGKNYMHRLAEMHAYYLYKASLRLAKEKGNARWMLKTKYPNGWLPIDTYNKNVDLVHTQPLLYDWETLRKQIIDNGGIRNSTVCAMMPCESSSLASNTTNGLYPIRNGVVIKIDEDSKKVFIAPGWEYLSDNYQIAFDIKDSDMTDTYAIFQKFTDQGISSDFYKKYTKDDNAVSFKDIFQSWLYRHKMGLKSRYYINSASGVDVSSSTIKEPEEQKGCDGGFCTL